MQISKEQIDIISSSISIYDIQKYIMEHQKEYEEFLKSLDNK